MQINQTVRFNHDERAVLEGARRSLRVEWPDYDVRDDLKEPRALTALVRGEAATSALLDRALAATRQLTETLRAETDPAYWGGTHVLGGDPAVVLAEARQQQLEAAIQAHRLLVDARAVLGREGSLVDVGYSASDD